MAPGGLDRTMILATPRTAVFFETMGFATTGRTGKTRLAQAIETWRAQPTAEDAATCILLEKQRR